MVRERRGPLYVSVLNARARGDAPGVGVLDGAQLGGVVGGVLHPGGGLTPGQDDLCPLFGAGGGLPQQSFLHKVIFAGGTGFVQHQQVKAAL